MLLPAFKLLLLIIRPLKNKIFYILIVFPRLFKNNTRVRNENFSCQLKGRQKYMVAYHRDNNKNIYIYIKSFKNMADGNDKLFVMKVVASRWQNFVR